MARVTQPIRHGTSQRSSGSQCFQDDVGRYLASGDCHTPTFGMRTMGRGEGSKREAGIRGRTMWIK